MPQPGWYADPEGTPERLRWWDGTRWTENVHGGLPAAASAGSRRRGPWPWVALVTVAGLVVTVGFGLSAGLLGRASTLGTPGAAPNAPLPVPSTSRTPSTPPPLPPVTTDARATPPAWSPTPYPSIPTAQPTPVADGCPRPASPTLSDGQLALTLPGDWVTVDGLTWLACAQAATSGEQAASVSIGISPFPASHLQEAAEYVWTIALLDAAIPGPMSMTSTPVLVSGLDGWMVSGTVAVADRLDQLTIIVVDTGETAPSVVTTLVGAHDAEGRAVLEGILRSVRPA